MRTLHEKYLARQNFDSSESGLEKVCNDDSFAFMTSNFAVDRFNIDSNCTLQLLDVAWTRHIAPLVSKNNTFREAWNRLLVAWAILLRTI